MDRKTLTIAEVEAALRASGGVCAFAAEALGRPPEEVRRRVRRSRRLQRALAEIAADNLEIAEAGLLAAIREGKLGAITYYLRTRGEPESDKEGEAMMGISSDHSGAGGLSDGDGGPPEWGQAGRAARPTRKGRSGSRAGLSASAAEGAGQGAAQSFDLERLSDDELKLLDELLSAAAIGGGAETKTSPEPRARGRRKRRG